MMMFFKIKAFPQLSKRSVIHNFCIANQNNLLEQSGKKTHTHTHLIYVMVFI